MTNDPYDLEFDSLVGSIPVLCRDCQKNYAEPGSDYCADCSRDLEALDDRET